MSPASYQVSLFFFLARFQIQLVDCPGDSLSGDAAIGVGIGPANGASAVCVSPNVFHELAAEVGDRGKHATSNDITLDFGEPKLHLIPTKNTSG